MPIVCQNIVHGRPLHAYLPNLPKKIFSVAPRTYFRSHISHGEKKAQRRKVLSKQAKLADFSGAMMNLWPHLWPKDAEGTSHISEDRRVEPNLGPRRTLHAKRTSLAWSKILKKSTPSQNVKSFYDMLCVSAAWFVSRWFMRIRHPPIVV